MRAIVRYSERRRWDLLEEAVAAMPDGRAAG